MEYRITFDEQLRPRYLHTVFGALDLASNQRLNFRDAAVNMLSSKEHSFGDWFFSIAEADGIIIGDRNISGQFDEETSLPAMMSAIKDECTQVQRSISTTIHELVRLDRMMKEIERAKKGGG